MGQFDELLMRSNINQVEWIKNKVNIWEKVQFGYANIYLYTYQYYAW